jgi:acetyl esterase/lipase
MVDQLEIQADVYRHEDVVKRPVVVWLHGGALIMGSRGGVPKQLLELAREHGFVVVSLDYRLAPEAKLADIIEDLKDGLEWVRTLGTEQFHADSSRMVVAGASAGGYLALMSGITIAPPPSAIVSYWGFGDVDGDWTTRPNEAYRKGKLIDKEKAWAGVGGQVLTNSNQTNGRGRAAFFVYLKQTGQWLNAVSGFDPQLDREKITPFCPIRNVSPNYPPTLFLHGTADKDVPVEQSIAMAHELKRHGVAHELITIEGGGHSLWGGDRALIERAFERSMEYIREHLSE